MTFAAIDFLSLSINLLIGIFVIICFLMTLVILMQRPKQEGLGAAFGAGVTDQVFGARTTNVLQRGTVYLGSAFFLISLTLAILIGLKNDKEHIAPRTTDKPAAAKSEPAPAAPEAPKSLSEELAPEPAPVTPPPAPEAPAPAPQTPAPEAPAPAPQAPAPEAAPAPAPETAPAPAPGGSPDKQEGQ